MLVCGIKDLHTPWPHPLNARRSPNPRGACRETSYRVASVLTWIGNVSSAGVLGWLLAGVLF